MGAFGLGNLAAGLAQGVRGYENTRHAQAATDYMRALTEANRAALASAKQPPLGLSHFYYQQAQDAISRGDLHAADLFNAAGIAATRGTALPPNVVFQQVGQLQQQRSLMQQKRSGQALAQNLGFLASQTKDPALAQKYTLMANLAASGMLPEGAISAIFKQQVDPALQALRQATTANLNVNTAIGRALLSGGALGGGSSPAEDEFNKLTTLPSVP